MREFLHVDDMAAACVHIMSLSRAVHDEQTSERCSHINVGTGEDCSIRELAESIADIVGFQGNLVFDVKRPDGAPRKLLDVSRLHRLGWKHTIGLREGLASAYDWYLNNSAIVRS